LIDELILPTSAPHLAKRLVNLRNARRRRHAASRAAPVRRRAPRAKDRAVILRKTAGRCHICGEKVGPKWHADHTMAHSHGGKHSTENYLPAHRLCNNYRWDYSSEEFQWVMKIGIWARKQMESEPRRGSEMLQAFYEYETRRSRRNRGRDA